MAKHELESLAARLKIKFRNPELLKQAFIHRSYLNEINSNLPSNERLEFLGDSILSLVVSNYLFTSRKTDAEGELTNLRAYIVKTKSLAQAARNLSLGDYLRLSKGEEMSGGRVNPQLLANSYEALLGAIFLDQGILVVEKVVKETLLSIFEKEIKSGPPKDAKSQLQELVQEQLKKSPAYKIIKTTGPDHAKQFTVAVYMGNKVYGEGIGSSKQEAEEKAAKEALKKLV